MPEGPPLLCPLCRVGLDPGDDQLTCSRCQRCYPIVARIPDLRLGPDPYLSLAEDRAKALELDGLRDHSFVELVAAYWRRTPEVPSALAERYAVNAVDGLSRAGSSLDGLEVRWDGAEVLDVGCGTGGLLQAVAQRGGRAVGVDMALRWLVIARRRLEEAGVSARLVAGDGAVLPFRAGSFDLTTCIETLEHASDQRGLLNACLSSVRPGGRALLVTQNRFSLWQEPTVRLWLLGYLPRRASAAYVRWRRSTRYEHVRTLSAPELSAMVGLRSDVGVGPARLPGAPPGASKHRATVSALYDRLRCRSFTRRTLTLVGPFLEVSGTVGSGAGDLTGARAPAPGAPSDG